MARGLDDLGYSFARLADAGAFSTERGWQEMIDGQTDACKAHLQVKKTAYHLAFSRYRSLGSRRRCALELSYQIKQKDRHTFVRWIFANRLISLIIPSKSCGFAQEITNSHLIS
jgi:hypothetical protein